MLDLLGSTVNIQVIEDALGAGRRFEIKFEFVANDDGTPVIDVALYEDGHCIYSSIGEYSFQDAINAVQMEGLK